AVAVGATGTQAFLVTAAHGITQHVCTIAAGAVPLATVAVAVGRHVHDARVVHDAGLDYARVVHDAGLGEPLLVVAVLGAFALALGLALALLRLAMVAAVLALFLAAFLVVGAAFLAMVLAVLPAIVAMLLARVVAGLRCGGRAEAGDQQGHQCRRGKGSGAGLDFHGVALVRRQARPLARGPLNVKSA